MSYPEQDLSFNKNEDKMKHLLADLRRKLEQIYLGGGQKKIDKEHSKGKMTARERVNYLLDTGTERIEIGAFAADGMYEEYGGCPALAWWW